MTNDISFAERIGIFQGAPPTTLASSCQGHNLRSTSQISVLNAKSIKPLRSRSINSNSPALHRWHVNNFRLIAARFATGQIHSSLQPFTRNNYRIEMSTSERRAFSCAVANASIFYLVLQVEASRLLCLVPAMHMRTKERSLRT